MLPLDDEPAERAAARSEVGGDEGQPGEPPARQSAASVEAEPAEPQQARASEGHRQVVRKRPLLRVLEPRTDDERANERRDTGREVNDGTASEIERPELEEPAFVRPDPVSDRDVDEETPQND